MAENYLIELKHVIKNYSGTVVVDDFNLTVNKGEFITFLGPSGCGKTTTLRMIGGFEMPTSGEILLDGKEISKLPPYKRPINTVFQKYALFPHLDVYDNIAFGLKLKKIPYEVTDKKGRTKTKFKHLTNEYIDKQVSNALKIVNLEELEDRNIDTLSGGQQQRVAIARAIVNQPEILLLDEPLGALDLKMRKDMQLELKAMHKKLGITFIYVTHDQEEALTMSDRIVVIKDGVIQQIGTPTEIYNEPINAFVADFIGESNIYNGTMIGKKEVRFIGTSWKCVDDFELNEKVDIVVRPEDVIIGKKGKGTVDGIITTKVFKGVHYQYFIAVGKNEVECKSTEDYELNSEVSLKVLPENIQIMKKEYNINSYFDSWINNQNQVVVDGFPLDVDITKLVPGSKLEDGYVIKDDKKYDFNDADVVCEIPLQGLTIYDDENEGQVKGEVIQSIWKGDHYQTIIRTENEEDFVVDAPDLYHVHDIVSITIPKELINIRIRGDISKYEK